jgi:hypothetical protein
MLMVLWNPLRRWWQTAFDAQAPAAAPVVMLRRHPSPYSSTARRATLPRQRPLTPFRERPVVAAPSAVDGARLAARRFWMTLDPVDRRRAAIGGSFAEVCAALERLAAVEEGRVG